MRTRYARACLVLALSALGNIAHAEPFTYATIELVADQVESVLQSANGGALQRCAEAGQQCNEAWDLAASVFSTLSGARSVLASELEAALPAEGDATLPDRRSILRGVDDLSSLLRAWLSSPRGAELASNDLDEISLAAQRAIYPASPPSRAPRIAALPAPPAPPEPPPYPETMAESSSAALVPSEAPPLALAGSVAPDLLAETPEVRFTPDLDALIARFQSDVALLYGFVRNEIRYQPYEGALKDSDLVIATAAGNDVDQASLLIAVLRRLGIPARYVTGTVAVPAARAMRLFGVTTAGAAWSFLSTANANPSYVYVNSALHIQFTHTWVEALVSLSNYRGISPNQGSEAWIPLDPSFEEVETNGGSDLAAAMNFNSTTFVAGYEQAPSSRSTTEHYLLQLQQFVSSTTPDKSIYDVIWKTTMVPEDLSALPASLPFKGAGTPSRTSSLADSTRHFFRATAIGLDFSIAVPSVSGRRITLGYEPASASDANLVAQYGNIYAAPAPSLHVRPVLRIAGQVVATGSSINFGSLTPVSFQFWMNGTMRSSQSVDVYGAGLLAIRVMSPDISASLVDRAANEFRQGVARIGQSGFVMEESLGAALHLSASVLAYERQKADCVMARSMRMACAEHAPDFVVARTTPTPFVSNGVVVLVRPDGFTFDLISCFSVGQTPLSLDGSYPHWDHWTDVAANSGSSLEYLVLERLWGASAISAVKILQVANQRGVPILVITPANRSSLVPQLLTHHPVVIANVNGYLDAGYTVTIPRDALTIDSWTGSGWKVEPSIGSAGYLISGLLNGGSFSERIAIIEGLELAGVISMAEADLLIGYAYFEMRIPFGPITREFSATAVDHPVLTGTRPHYGIDQPLDLGTEVRAVDAGQVAFAGIQGGYGNLVAVFHGTDSAGNSYYTRYGHLSRIDVVLNGDVSRSTTIGLVGSTGTSSGPHLHFEVIIIPVTGGFPIGHGQVDNCCAHDPMTVVWPQLTPP